MTVLNYGKNMHFISQLEKNLVYSDLNKDIWLDLKKVRPLKNMDILLVDDQGYIDTENTKDVDRHDGKKFSWDYSWYFGNSNKVIAWCPLDRFFNKQKIKQKQIKWK